MLTGDDLITHYVLTGPSWALHGQDPPGKPEEARVEQIVAARFPYALSCPDPRVIDLEVSVKHCLQACIELLPPLLYERAKEGFERFRTKTARTITI
jgi:hypothetical protein